MKIILVATAVVFAFATSAAAHHSHGAFDLSKWTPMEGSVRQVVLVVPHAIVYMDVKDEKTSETTVWALEAGSAGEVFANGVKRGDIRPGDHIKVRCHLLRDGSPGCLLGFITPDHGDAARGHGVERQWER